MSGPSPMLGLLYPGSLGGGGGTTGGSVTLTGNVTGSGTGTIATTIASGVVTNAMLAGNIAASKLVGTDIAKVGTVTTGTWNATTIATAHGGTGQSTWNDGQLAIGRSSDHSLVQATLTAGAGINIANGSGSITIAATSLGGNPISEVTLTPQNGIALTFMRSDAAPALDQSISPTWTGLHTFNANVTLADDISLQWPSGTNMLDSGGALDVLGSTSAQFGDNFPSNITFPGDGSATLFAGNGSSLVASDYFSLSDNYSNSIVSSSATSLTLNTNGEMVFSNNGSVGGFAFNALVGNVLNIDLTGNMTFANAANLSWPSTSYLAEDGSGNLTVIGSSGLTLSALGAGNITMGDSFLTTNITIQTAFGAVGGSLSMFSQADTTMDTNGDLVIGGGGNTQYLYATFQADANLSSYGNINIQCANPAGNTLALIAELGLVQVGDASLTSVVTLQNRNGSNITMGYGNDINIDNVGDVTVGLASTTQNFNVTVNAGIVMQAVGNVTFNALAGGVFAFNSAPIGFFGGTPVSQQIVEPLTNGVTSGGTTDTIADYTSLTVYSADAATIRNNLYQLARKVQQLEAALGPTSGYSLTGH